MKNPSPRSQHGFTLTEMAIVLGVTGLIIGAIWAAASLVYNNMRLSQAQQEIISIANNVRSLYASRSTFTATADNTDITVAMANAGAFPGPMIAVTPTSTNLQTYPRLPWGTPVGIFTHSSLSGGPQNAFFFWTEATMLPSQCQPLLGSIVGPGADSGLIGAWGGQGMSWVGGSSIIGNAYIRSISVSSFTQCNGVGFMFLLH